MYYGLVLSMMRNENWETSDQLVAWAESREALERFVEAEKVEPWEDDNPAMANLNGTCLYRKVFRKDGPLEWYNPTSASLPDRIVEIESPEEFSERIRIRAYQERQMELARTLKVE